MPTDEFLLDLDMNDVRKCLLDVLGYRGEHSLLLAIIVIFEALVVLASMRDGYSYANTESLRRIDRAATRNIKKLRDTIAHAFYDKSKISDMINRVVKHHSITTLYLKFFDRQTLGDRCTEFEKTIINTFCYNSCDNVTNYTKKIIDKMPPSVREKYKGSDTEIALKFAYDVISNM